MPFNANIHDLSADQGECVDEFTVLREIATNLGRILCLVTIAILSLYIPISRTFVIAAVASIAMNFAYRLPEA